MPQISGPCADVVSILSVPLLEPSLLYILYKMLNYLGLGGVYFSVREFALNHSRLDMRAVFMSGLFAFMSQLV